MIVTADAQWERVSKPDAREVPAAGQPQKRKGDCDGRNGEDRSDPADRAKTRNEQEQQNWTNDVRGDNVRYFHA